MHEHIKEVSIVKHPRSNNTIPPFALCINDAPLLYLSTSVPLSRLLFWVYFLAMWGNLRTARLNNELVVLHFSNLNSLSPRIAFHCPKPYLFNPRLIHLSSSGEKGIFFFLLGGLILFFVRNCPWAVRLFHVFLWRCPFWFRFFYRRGIVVAP